MIVDWPPVTPGPKRCNCNNLTHILTKQEINLEQFEQAVMATVHNEPHLRADVDLKGKPEKWTRATDFTEIFTFKDVTGEGYKDVGDVWHLVEDEVNRPWNYGSGKPLYRCTLLKVVDGYMVMNCYHHGAGDGTTGMFIMGGIMDHYNTLQAGDEVTLSPHEPKPCVEDLTQCNDSSDVLRSLVVNKVSRAQTYKPFLPFDSTEMNANRDDSVPVNKTLFREGSPKNYQAIRQRCRVEKVTVGSLALASCYMAQAVVHAEASGQDEESYSGMKDQVIDIPVNIRRQLEPPIGDQYGGLYITELTTKLSVHLDTHLWNLARDIGQQMKDMMKENQHIVFSQAKKEFEAGESTDIAESVAPEHVVDTLVSNKRFYPFPMEFEWGTIRAVHSTGSYWTPGFCNYLLLLQATKMFTYNMVYCPGEKNMTVANKLIDTFVNIMEGSSETSNGVCLKDFIKSFN